MIGGDGGSSHTHNWSPSGSSQPSCTTSGYQEYTCTGCGERKMDTIAALGHSMGSWETTREATCTSSGTKTKSCSRCSYTETDTIPALGHAYGSYHTVVYPTCTEDGTERKTCSRCSASVSRTLSATGHDWGSWYVTVKPTCVSTGLDTRTCLNDSSHTDTRVTAIVPDNHKDDSPYDGYCDYNRNHDLNTAPTITIGDFNGEFFKAGDIITLTVTATKGTDAPETWDTLTLKATLDGIEGTAQVEGAGVGTQEATAEFSWNVDELDFADGSYVVTVIATDSRDVSTEKTTTSEVVIDRSAPEKPMIEANENWTNDDVEVTITAGNADVAGVEKVTYVLSGATQKEETEITSGRQITIVEEGETTITAYTYDKAGNKSEAETKVVRIEKTKPTVTYSLDGSDGKYEQSFTTIVTVEDLGEFISGVNADTLVYLWSTKTSGITENDFTEEGTKFVSGESITTPENVSDIYYLWVLAEDNAGNQIITVSKGFYVDQVSPVVEFNRNENETYQKAHTVLVTVKDEEGVINAKMNQESFRYLWLTEGQVATKEDFMGENALSGVVDESSEMITQTITTPEGVTGEYYLWVYAEDKVGNEVIANSGVQRVDNTAPNLTYTFLKEAPVYMGVHVTVDDSNDGALRSGVDESSLKYEISLRPLDVGSRTYPYTYLNDQDQNFPENLEGQYYFYVIAYDNAGNYVEKEDIIVIDTKVPRIIFTPDGNTTFANSQSTVVTLEDYSMIASAKYVWLQDNEVVPDDFKFEGTFSTGDTIITPSNITGSYYLWVMVEDKAGNVVKKVSNEFRVDNQAPTITFAPNGEMDYKKTHKTQVTVLEGADESGVKEDSLKYLWVEGKNKPTKEQFTKSFTNGEEITTPTAVEGEYYLWIYAEDNVGNVAITGSKLFNLDDKSIMVSFEPFENTAYAPEHSTKVTFSDGASRVNENSLAYFWTTDETLTDPAADLFKTKFVNGGLIKTPEGAQGIYYLWVIGEDYVGNQVKERSGKFCVDTTELPIDLKIIQNVGLTGKGIHIEIDDSVKAIKEDTVRYLISDSTKKPLVSDYEKAASNHSDVLFDEGIEKQAYVWVMAEDVNGIVHMSYIYMIIDTKAPEITIDKMTNQEDLTKLDTVVTVKDYSIVEERKYIWTKDITQTPAVEDMTNTFETGDSIVAPEEDGDYYLWVYAKDIVSNEKLVRSDVFKVDHTAPTAPTILGNEKTESGDAIVSGGLTNKDVLITIEDGIDERTEGVETKVTIKKDGRDITNDVTKDENGKFVLTEDGEYEITASTKDKAENESETTTYTVTIDKVAPVNPTIKGYEASTEEPEIPSGTTTKKNVWIEVEADAGEKETKVIILHNDVDVTDTIVRDEAGRYYLDTEGSYIVKAQTTDEAGNVSEMIEYVVTIERKATLEKPVLEVKEESTNKELADKEPTKDSVVVATDEDEEGETTEITIKDKDGNDKTGDFTDEDGKIVITEEGEYEVIAQTKDEYGNESEEVKQTVIIDRTAPEAPTIIGKTETSNTVVGDKGSTNENVLVEIVAGKDNREEATVTVVVVSITKDGVDVTDEITVNADGKYELKEEGTYVITVKNQDELGNESEEVSYEVTINRSLPNAPIVKPTEVPKTPSEEDVVVPDQGSTKEELEVKTDEDEEGEKTTVVIIDEDGNDRTDEFTKEDGKIVIDKTGEYDIIATTVKKDDPSKKSESIVHVIVDLDAPVATDANKETKQNTKVEGNMEATDNRGVVEYVVTKEPTNGTLVLDKETGRYEYTPNQDYYGEDSFTVIAKDEVGNESEPAVVTIFVRKKLEESDIVTSKDISIYKNQTYTSKELPTTDKNGDALTYTVKAEATNGAVRLEDGKIVYTPNKDYIGTDTFTIEATNGTETIEIVWNVQVKKKSNGGGGGSSTDKPDPKPQEEEHTWYIRGYEDGTVRPDGKITREEIAMILYRLIAGTEKEEMARNTQTFSDVLNTRWSYEAIEYLARMGILEGYEDGTFKPAKQITRAEFATILVRYQNLKERKAIDYKDVSNDYWAKEAIEKAVEEGLMIGYQDHTFKPENDLTRAETATVINRLLNRKVENVTVTDNPFSDLRKNHWAYEDMMEAVTTHSSTKDENGVETWKSHEYPYLKK